MSLLAAFLTFAAIANDGAVLTGRLVATPKCRSGEVQIWVSTGKALLYQALVPVGGTYEFHVVPGKYSVAATSVSGCLAEATVKVAAGNSHVDTLRLEPVSGGAKRNPATWQSCPTCGAMTGGFVADPRFSTGGPWWSPYGSYSYPNFRYPGAWSGWVMTPSFYPGGGGFTHGGGYMGKPNIYLHGKKGTKVSIRVKYGLKATTLAAVPLHGKAGWKGVITGENAFVVNRALYPYLYFDYRFDLASLQDQEGFCSNAEGLMPRLLDALRTSGFSDYEMKDFSEYWSIKMPPSDEYCVYPQDERTLSRVAPLEITPTPARITRMNFVIVLKKAMASYDGPFSIVPHAEWKITKEREPASDDAFVIHEWGVGFLGGEN